MPQAKGIRGQRGEKLQASRPDTVGDFADVVTDQSPERHRGAFANPFAWRSSRPPLRDCFGKNRRSTSLAKADDLWPCQELRPISHEGASLLELLPALVSCRGLRLVLMRQRSLAHAIKRFCHANCRRPLFRG